MKKNTLTGYETVCELRHSYHRWNRILVSCQTIDQFPLTTDPAKARGAF